MADSREPIEKFPVARPTARSRVLQVVPTDTEAAFRAVQLRLRATVGERLASAPAPKADDAAGKVQVAVLECIFSMEQLHKALTRERQERAGQTAVAPCVATDSVSPTERLV
jgi:hypothetical protein